VCADRLTGGGVLISQPVHQHAYEAAVAAQQAGLLRHFVTGLYYTGNGITSSRLRGWMPSPWQDRLEYELRRRWHPDLLASQVLTLPRYHLLALALRKASGRLASNLDTWAHGRFDRAVAARLRVLQNVGIVHGFEGSAEATLRTAKRLGMATILDVPSAHEERLRACDPSAHASVGRLTAKVQSERDLADYLLAPSDYVIRCLVDHGVPVEKVIKLPYGVDLELFTPVERHAAGAERCRFLFVGQIGISKGVHHLLEAWRRLALPRSDLVLVGPLHWSGREILQRHEGSCRWVGSVPRREVHRWFAASDVCVLPSLSDGWGLVITEAMATGLPVITSSACGATVRNGLDGLVVPPGDVDALCAAIRFLYDHPGERERMGASARTLVQDWYSRRQYEDRLQSVYKAILANGDPREEASNWRHP